MWIGSTLRYVMSKKLLRVGLRGEVGVRIDSSVNTSKNEFAGSRRREFSGILLKALDLLLLRFTLPIERFDLLELRLIANPAVVVPVRFILTISVATSGKPSPSTSPIS